ncbi:MAG: hypothetical protein IT359_21225 [Gemmatimonadaceae bacterium]|nr:hypothetical protein [Gemmatimonadaceae bacterium]
MNLRDGALRGRLTLFVVCLLAATTPVSARAQGIDTVTVEQRLLMTPDLTPAEARRRAIDAALAEAVRRVAGVRVQSSALSTLDERGPGGARIDSRYSSVIALDAAARAVDYQVTSERWDTRQIDGAAQLYLQITVRAAVERERGRTDAGFAVALSLNAARYDVRGDAASRNDEIIATVRSTRAAHLTLFTLAGDSVQRLFPNAYLPDVPADSGALVELPALDWRERGLRLRATLPPGVDERRELLLIVATRAPVAPPPLTLSVMELQRWLVRIPLQERAMAFASYDVRRAGR